MKKDPSRASPSKGEKKTTMAENLGFFVGRERKEGKGKLGGFKCWFESLIYLLTTFDEDGMNFIF